MEQEGVRKSQKDVSRFSELSRTLAPLEARMMSSRNDLMVQLAVAGFSHELYCVLVELSHELAIISNVVT